MTITKIAEAIEEAGRFIEKAQKARTWMEQNDPMCMGLGNQYTAACRRASMDLTRALADMRKWGEEK